MKKGLQGILLHRPFHIFLIKFSTTTILQKQCHDTGSGSHDDTC